MQQRKSMNGFIHSVNRKSIRIPDLCHMSLTVVSLNSGSNGNCYYVGNEYDAVLIDAGISRKEILRRLDRLGLPLERIRAIFITHEHGDHIRGAEVLSRRHQIPVYITEATRRQSRIPFILDVIRHFTGEEPLEAGTLTIHPVKKQHDGIDPHSFVVEYNGMRAGIFTDIGEACDRVIHHFKSCHAAILESNYDEEMLEHGPYPWPLKQRIRGSHGHLSNDQALELFLTHRSPLMQLLILGHLSAHNNKPELVEQLFAPHANGTRVVVASRYEEGEVFTVTR